MIDSSQWVRRRSHLVLPLLVYAALSACAGSGEGLDSSGRPLSEGGGGTLSADFDSIQANVFTPICTACHVGATAPQGLRLDSANSYNLLVGIASSEVPSLLRVRPGDPDNSYLIQKLEGRAAVGAQMPLGGPVLPAETIAFVRQWIRDGALRTAAANAAPVSSLAVTALAPADGEQLQQAPKQLVVGFSRDLDVTRVDTGTVRLLAARDGELSLQPVDAEIRVNPDNARALLVIPRAVLPPGDYLLQLSTESGNAVAAADGAVLQSGTAPISFVVEPQP